MKPSLGWSLFAASTATFMVVAHLSDGIEASLAVLGTALLIASGVVALRTAVQLDGESGSE